MLLQQGKVYEVTNSEFSISGWSKVPCGCPMDSPVSLFSMNNGDQFTVVEIPIGPIKAALVNFKEQLGYILYRNSENRFKEIE